MKNSNNGHISKDGKITWAQPPHWDEMNSGSYNDMVNVANGGDPASHPDVGPGISDELMEKQDLTNLRGANLFAEALHGYQKKKEE